MSSKQFYEPLTDLYTRAQQNTLSKLISGVIMGLLLIFAITLVTIGLDIIFRDSTFWLTFNNDLRGLGIVAGVVLALEVWGLIPHQAEDTDNE